MVYEYSCEHCQTTTDIVKSVKDFERVEHCEKCASIMTRAFAPQRIHLYGTKVEDAYFNVGLGQVVKGSQHVKEIVKERKLIEVGNERPEKHLKPKLNTYDF